MVEIFASGAKEKKKRYPEKIKAVYNARGGTTNLITSTNIGETRKRILHSARLPYTFRTRQ